MFVQSIKDCQMSLDAYRLLLSYVDSVVDSVPLEELVQFYRDQLYGDYAKLLHDGTMTMSELLREIEQEAPHLLD
jgi:hypothetical protein